MLVRDDVTSDWMVFSWTWVSTHNCFFRAQHFTVHVALPTILKPQVDCWRFHNSKFVVRAFPENKCSECRSFLDWKGFLLFVCLIAVNWSKHDGIDIVWTGLVLMVGKRSVLLYVWPSHCNGSRTKVWWAAYICNPFLMYICLNSFFRKCVPCFVFAFSCFHPCSTWVTAWLFFFCVVQKFSGCFWG